MSAGPVLGAARAPGIAPGAADAPDAPDGAPAAVVNLSGELTAALRARCRGRVAVMGIGNPLRGDDGVGSIVARKLRRAFAWVNPTEDAPDRPATTVAIVDAEEIPESYLDVLEAARPAVVVLIDAAEMGGPPGALLLVEGGRLGDHTTFTHRTPLAPVARYLEQRTGATILLAGIQPGAERWGEGLSGEVEDTANRLANILWDALRPSQAESPAGASGASRAMTPEALTC